jgi:hypothetical protein
MSITAASGTTLGIAIAVFASIAYLNSADSGIVNAVSAAQFEDYLAHGRLLGQPESKVSKLLGQPMSHSYACSGVYGYEWKLSDETEVLHIESRAGLTTVAEIRENRHLN